jgi:5S rRNA maturation endonuclease (ribonuclease M5)
MRNFANYHVDVRRHTSGVVKTICEQCLPTRHNKRDRSLRVNIDTGHCHCYHCGADFYVPDDAEEREKAERQAARKRRAASAVPQHFHRPVFDASKTTLSEATERWLVETRCIPQSVIAGLRITEQEEFMSQSGAKERCVCFNYFEDGKLVNTKFRSGAKNFKMVQGAELIPYNIDSVLGQDTCIIHEGELDAASSLAAGFKSVISVPAGANANLSWLDRFMESHFENLKDIIIAVDTDSAGLKLRDELVNRLGAERAMIIYRRSEEEMPARIEEVKHAKEEGVEFLTLHNPIEYIADELGKVKQVILQKMELGEPDASGRRSPVAIPGATETIDIDLAIVSVGVSPNPIVPSSIPGLEMGRKGTIAVNENMQSSIPTIYAGGDIVRGGATVILAMGDGRKAAAAMHEQLSK